MSIIITQSKVILVLNDRDSIKLNLLEISKHSFFFSLI